MFARQNFIFDLLMKKRQMKKNAKKIEAQNAYLPAAQTTPARMFPFFPVSTTACTPSDRQRIISRARYLENSMPEIRHAIATMISLVGTLQARPASTCEEWNEKARKAFYARVNDPFLFSVDGKFDWNTAQNALERRAIVDGDNITILTATPYGNKI